MHEVQGNMPLLYSQAGRYLNLKIASDVVSNTGYSAARRDERGDYTIYEEQEVQNLGSLNGGSQTRRVATHTGKTKTTAPKFLFDQPTGRCHRPIDARSIQLYSLALVERAM